MCSFRILVTLCGVLLGIPLTASAIPARSAAPAQKYCVALSKDYGHYVANHSHNRAPTVEGAYAKAACKQHHPSKAIPIFASKLEEAKMPLPKK